MSIPKYTQCQIWEYEECSMRDPKGINRMKGKSAWANVPGMQKNRDIFDMRDWSGKIGSMRCVQSVGGKAWAYVS